MVETNDTNKVETSPHQKILTNFLKHFSENLYARRKMSHIREKKFGTSFEKLTLTILYCFIYSFQLRFIVSLQRACIFYFSKFAEISNEIFHHLS